MHTFSNILLFIVILNHVVASSELLSKTVGRLSRVVDDISVPPMQLPGKAVHCMTLQCKFICVNGKQDNLLSEILKLQNATCQSIDELHLYNYEFPNKIIPKHFLGNISHSVKQLSIYASDVVHIESGAFESSILTSLHLESLKLIEVHKGIFENISEKFVHITLIQKDDPIKNVNDNFLKHIKYQIKSINIQTGLLTVENLTQSGCLLNNLEDVNLSFNNFGKSLTATSFVKLSVVEKLNLSHSEISFLPESVFFDIVGTLRELDLSDNKLAVISRNVFGWHDLGKSLVIYLQGNPWECSCDLRTEMIYILAYQSEEVYCNQSKKVLVTDEQLCNSSCSESDSQQCHSIESILPVPSPPPINPPGSSAEMGSNSLETSTEFEKDLTTESNGFAKLQCHKYRSSYETEIFTILWPSAQFDIRALEGFKVEVKIIAFEVSLNGTYGILWFSNVTTQYYKMEVNYNEFGLGCFGIRQYVTTIENLLPDTAYTFCLVLKDELTVSPFSCKSVYIDGNLNIKYNAWLTTNMRPTGITLLVLGIVLCNFLGIICVFLLLKQKPILVKGSKRVATQKNDSMNIIVFPKDKTLQKFRIKEEQIAKQNSLGLDFRRLSSVSTTSVESNQSYMNPITSNLYEIIPTFRPHVPTYLNHTEIDINYADVPFKKKRTSNDPLPEVPSLTKLSTPILQLRGDDVYAEYGLNPNGCSV